MELFKKLKKGKKVRKLSLKFRCAKCGRIIEANYEIFAQREEKPFSAQSSSSTLICPKCNSIEFVVMPQYEWLYRRKCHSCNQMFETPFSWEMRCKPCERGEILQYETY
jgi:DNA-directed RNA polymerase subunit RPC12/RpoP